MDAISKMGAGDGRPVWLRAHRLSMPLRVPYKLAMGGVTAFDVILVEAEGPEGVGWGEATILTGYTDETIEGAWALSVHLCERLRGRGPHEADALLDDHFAAAPFTVSAFRSALELSREPGLLSRDAPCRVPILAGINATDPAGFEAEMEAAIAAGFGTLKIKVGFEMEADLARLHAIQQVNRGRARLRVDGNQGFSREEACAFAARVSPDSIELLEQPCHAGDWDAAVAVAAVSSVPMMLDESIYGPADVERAARLGCARFIKVKLMKMGGIAALRESLRLIRDLGMEPVIGNGVATEIGCWHEAAVAADLVRTAGEMNGFLRPVARLLSPPLRAEGGAILLPVGAPAAPDPDALRSLRMAEAGLAPRCVVTGWGVGVTT